MIPSLLGFHGKGRMVEYSRGGRRGVLIMLCRRKRGRREDDVGRDAVLLVWRVCLNSAP